MAEHTGEVPLRDGDNCVGQTLNRSARLRGIGHGRQVLVSAAAVAVLADRLPDVVTWKDLGVHRLREDVRMDLLVPTDTASVCAYQGHARYWTVHVDDTVVTDVAWSYEDPHNYATTVKDMICFFNERVDVSVDGERLAHPRTPWSD